MKPVKFLVMSVGPYEKNGTCKYFESIDGKDKIIVVLPKQFEENAAGYRKHGIEVYSVLCSSCKRLSRQLQ